MAKQGDRRRAGVTNIKIEKRPGDDWVVEVLVIDENEVYPVTVFGAKDAAEAEADAIHSFSMRRRDELRVLTVERL